jgi:hypothetical protein
MIAGSSKILTVLVEYTSPMAPDGELVFIIGSGENRFFDI